MKNTDCDQVGIHVLIRYGADATVSIMRRLYDDGSIGPPEAYDPEYDGEPLASWVIDGPHGGYGIGIADLPFTTNGYIEKDAKKKALLDEWRPRARAIIEKMGEPYWLHSGAAPTMVDRERGERR
jgi:hypothetical protein